jgi:hypothetical protein
MLHDAAVHGRSIQEAMSLLCREPKREVIETTRGSGLYMAEAGSKGIANPTGEVKTWNRDKVNWCMEKDMVNEDCR